MTGTVVPGKTRGNRKLRFLDRYVGIPVVFMLGALRRKRTAPSHDDVRRIGLMKTVAIGDMVLLSGVVRDVRAHYPDATIVLISGEDNAGVARLMLQTGDEHVIVSPHRPISSAIALRRARLDVLLDFGAWPRFDAVLSALSGAGYRVGFRTDGQGRHFAYDRTADYSSGTHEVDNNRRLAGAIGLDSRSPPSLVAPGAVAAGRLPPAPYIVLHAWPGGFMRHVKEWPEDRWLDLAARFAARGYAIVLSGGAGDLEKNERLVMLMARAGVRAVNGAGSYEVEELADVLRASSLVVSVDTGIMHLSAGLGVPTVGLQGPTSARRWGPLGPRARAVESELPGCGYLNLGWEYRGQRDDCMTGVSVERVTEAAEAVLVGQSDSAT